MISCPDGNVGDVLFPAGGLHDCLAQTFTRVVLVQKFFARSCCCRISLPGQQLCQFDRSSTELYVSYLLLFTHTMPWMIASLLLVGIDSNMSDEDLKGYFEKFGTVRSDYGSIDRTTGKLLTG